LKDFVLTKKKLGMGFLLTFLISVIIWKIAWTPNPFVLLYSIFVTLFLGATIALALGYQHVSPNLKFTPSVSIVVPVYNENWRTLKKVISSALKTRYPGKKEVIVVDDGSTNGISEKLKKMKGIKSIIFQKNRGNKFARAEGIKNASGEIIVFIDSDTMLHRDSILHIVAPFKHKSVGAVSGHLRVKDPHRTLMTKLQDGWYYTNFRVFRGAEDRMRFVSCCPGAFSAYRKSVITPAVMKEWLYGKFLGLEVTAGVDRALTNLVLRTHDVVYQSSAIAYTVVPSNWKKFIKQQIRWTKSWIRETLYLSTFAFKKGTRSLFFYASASLHLMNYGFLFFSLFILPFLTGLPFYPVFYLTGTMLAGGVYALFCRKETRLWKWRAVFPALYALIILPIFIFSLLTLKDASWGTR